MALKNINILEQHMEKIVLGAAAAGALVMVYFAAQKVGFQSSTGEIVGPNDVETGIQAEIKKVDEHREQLERQGPPKISVPNYPEQYKDRSGKQPLDPEIVSLRFPPFAPINLLATSDGARPPTEVRSIIPEPVTPEMVRAELLQLAVADKVSTDGLPVAPPENRQWSIQTHNVVVIDGWIPVGNMILEMVKQKDENKRLTPDVQRGVVYRVRVLRRELQGNGTWTKDEEVTAAKGSPAPADLLPTTMADGDLPARLTEITGQLQWIQLPNYYVNAAGEPIAPPIMKKPVPKAIADENTKLKNDIAAAQAGPAAGMPRTVAMPGAGLGGLAGAGAPPVIPGADTTSLTLESVRTMEVQPFTFWDDSVKPDHTYKYSVQIQLVNPGFGWKWGLEKPEMKTQPVIPVGSEKIVVVPGVPITVHSDTAFFITGSSGLGANGGVSGQLFHQDNGRWYQTTFTAQNGMNIAAPMFVGGQSMDVDTNFALVDSETIGNNTHVILKDPSGNLVTRDSNDDRNRGDMQTLQSKVKEGATAAAATTTAPGTGNPPSATRTATRPTLPPRGTPVPTR